MTRVLQLNAFRRLFTAYTLNELAWSIALIALPLLVYRQTGSALGAMGFFLCSQALPALVTPMLVGRLAHLPIPRLLRGLYAAEALIYVGLAVLARHFHLVPVLLVVVLDGMIALLARSLARAASVAITTPVGLLREGNSLLNVSFSVCYVAGAALGGVVVAEGGVSVALVVCAAMFGAIGVSFLGVAIPDPAEPDAAPERKLRSALAYARRRSGVGWLLGVQGIAVMFFTVSIPVELVFAERTLHKGAGGYAALLSAWGAGAVLGSLLHIRARRARSHVLLGVSAGALALGFAIMAVSSSILVAGAAALIAGIGNGVESVAARTALQEQLEPRWVVTVGGLNEAILQVVPGAGILIGGFVTQWAGARGGLWLAAAGSLAVGLLFVSVLERLLEPVPQHAGIIVEPAPDAARPAAASGTAGPFSGG